MSDSDDYEIGYGKPPPGFPKGVSGNPRGRPKRSSDPIVALREALEKRVSVRDTDGGQRTISKLEAFVTQLANQAASGNQPAMAKILKLIPLLGEQAASEMQTKALSDADQQIFAEIVERIRGSQPEPPEALVQTPSKGDTDEPRDP